MISTRIFISCYLGESQSIAQKTERIEELRRRYAQKEGNDYIP